MKIDYGVEAHISIPDRARFSSLHSIQIGGGLHPVSYPMGTGVPVVKLYLHYTIPLHGIMLN
jgi:hypothetical protein